MVLFRISWNGYWFWYWLHVCEGGWPLSTQATGVCLPTRLIFILKKLLFLFMFHTTPFDCSTSKNILFCALEVFLFHLNAVYGHTDKKKLFSPTPFRKKTKPFAVVYHSEPV